MFRAYTIKQRHWINLEGLMRQENYLFDTAKRLDPNYAGDFILSPPKVPKATASSLVSILSSAD